VHHHHRHRRCAAITEGRLAQEAVFLLPEEANVVPLPASIPKRPVPVTQALTLVPRRITVKVAGAEVPPAFPPEIAVQIARAKVPPALAAGVLVLAVPVEPALPLATAAIPLVQALPLQITQGLQARAGQVLAASE